MDATQTAYLDELKTKPKTREVTKDGKIVERSTLVIDGDMYIATSWTNMDGL